LPKRKATNQSQEINMAVRSYSAAKAKNIKKWKKETASGAIAARKKARANKKASAQAARNARINERLARLGVPF
jgi:hypothetical protein